MAPHRLTQAVLNLVVNAGEAIPASRHGLVRVWAEATRRGDAVRLGVSDNGVGMTPEVRRRAFEIFFTTKPRGLGTGLGLALVRNVAERAGGAVDIQSTLGQGTTVTLLLPASVPAGADRPESAGTRATVSVDDARAADLLRHLLERAGAEVRMDGDPEGTSLWIVAPRADRLARARSWVTAGSGRRLVLFGSPLPRARGAWAALGPSIVDRPDELDAVRAALSLALAREHGGGGGPQATPAADSSRRRRNAAHRRSATSSSHPSRRQP